MISLDNIKSILATASSNGISLAEDLNCSPQALIIDKKDIFNVCRILHTHEELYFDFLSSITGIDNGPESASMEVVYNLYSIPNATALMLKVKLERDLPSIPSVIEIWKGADWQEREIYDLFGIVFKGHPDLRRILLPSDWEGHPMLKDYEEQVYYHGIKVKYD